MVILKIKLCYLEIQLEKIYFIKINLLEEEH